MTYLRQNLARVSTSANEPLVVLTDGTVVGCFTINSYYSLSDTQTTIATASYFDADAAIFNTGDLIFVLSTASGTVATYFMTNTNGVITLSPFNTGAGPIGTANITDGAVTVAKMANLAADTLLGNPTGGALAPSAITLDDSLEFSGTVLGVPESYIVYETATFSAAQFNTCFTAAREIIAAPGANKVIRVHSATVVIDYVAAFTGGGVVTLQYDVDGNAGGDDASASIAAAVFTGVTADSLIGVAGAMPITLAADSVNKPVCLAVFGANFAGGAGTTVAVHVAYSVYTVTV